MNSLTLYTNLFFPDETAADLRKRGAAVRFHPDPAAARADARDEDLIAELEVQVPADTVFVIYRQATFGAAVFAQGPEFATAYREASAIPGDGETRITGVLAGPRGAARNLVPLASFITALGHCRENRAAA